jgi:hypothetical protein
VVVALVASVRRSWVICHETVPATAVAVMVIVMTLVHNSSSTDGAGMVLVEQDVTLFYG